MDPLGEASCVEAGTQTVSVPVVSSCFEDEDQDGWESYLPPPPDFPPPPRPTMLKLPTYRPIGCEIGLSHMLMGTHTERLAQQDDTWASCHYDWPAHYESWYGTAFEEQW